LRLQQQRPAARILIADNLRLFAEACKRILEPEFSIVGIVTDGGDLFSAASTLRPDIVILDTNLVRLHGFDAGHQLKRKYPSAKLVFLSMTLSAEVVAEAFRSGALAYVTKQSSAEELLLAIRRVNRGKSYLSPLIAQEAVSLLLTSTKQSETRITTRQYEVLRMLAEGKTMKQVADAIEVQPRTVAFHKYKMMQKLNIKTNAELLGYAFKQEMRSLNDQFEAVPLYNT
jgi:DNA-binding NarL/FixJ family response regulator